MRRQPKSIEQDVLGRGPDTVQNGKCTECGRDYSDQPGLQRCPSSDCPSHWERVGIAWRDSLNATRAERPAGF